MKVILVLFILCVHAVTVSIIIHITNYPFYYLFYFILGTSAFTGFPSGLHPFMFLYHFCAVKLTNNNKKELSIDVRDLSLSR